MSTIDMTQVAGLQAVDAEGNVIGTLSVDDLTNLVANNLVKSTQNQIAAARSVSTMSEASTLAASDDYENTLPIDANPASVRTLDADGNPKQTGISALAQVVGGLIGAKNFIKTSNNLLTSRDDMNSLESGIIYSFAPESGFPSNFPSSARFGRGIIDTRICYPHLLQIIYAFNSSSLKIVARMSYDEGTHWYDWMEL